MDADIKVIEYDAPVTQSGGTRRRRRRKARTPSPEPSASVIKEPEIAAPPTNTASPKKPAVVIIEPPRKKPAKLMLIPKATAAATKKRLVPKKTFKHKAVRMLVDNTAKTRKHRKQILSAVDVMTLEQLRGVAIKTKLVRRETITTVPVELLRQMVKDLQTMKGGVL